LPRSQSPRFSARRSSIDGRGVFALVDLPAEELLLEYRGEVIDWDEACRRFDQSQNESHTFLFDRGDGLVIDGGVGGNLSRWFNHGCDSNCDTIESDGRIFIHTVRPIKAGDELLIDYRLIVERPRSKAARATYACRCGASSCRGTMLAP
jgi:SET domain-containing protein